MKHLKLIIALSLITLTGFSQVNNLVGKEAPAIVFQGTLDKKVKPDFHKKKILVLDFWATWCAPCIANFPHFNALSEKFASKDVIFALISDEPEHIVNTFFERTQREVKGLNLTDSTKTTKKNFGINYIPTCVVIDENNMVRWVGAGQELTAEILEAIIKKQPLPVAEKVGLLEGEHAKKSREEIVKEFLAAKNQGSAFPYYKFAVANGNNSTADLSYGSMNDGDFSDYNQKKSSLAEVLQTLSGYNMKAQFITNNATKLNQVLDVDFFSSSDPTLFRKYRSRIIPGLPRRNMMMELLGDALKFELNLEIKQKEYFEIVIDSLDQFKKFQSLQSNLGGISNSNNQLVITGQTLKTLSAEIMKALGQIVQVQISDNNKYDLILDISNAETLEKSLNFHGLKLVKRNGDVEILNIDFY